MGPCPRCGQQTETDANFCPTCGGYAAPATVYAYAPRRLELSADEAPAPRLAGSPVMAGVSIGPAALAPLAVAPAARLAALELRYNSHRSGRRIALAATLAVLLIAAATAGVVLATHGAVSSHQRASAPAAGRAPHRAARSASVPPAAGLVGVAASAARSPYLAVVRPFLTSYFSAINRHDYAAYAALFSPAVGGESAAAFSAGYGTTTDSSVTLQSVGVVGTGELAAQVSFVSHQLPSASPTNSSCTAWTISLYLLSQDGNYLLQPPPAGYQPSDGACA